MKMDIKCMSSSSANPLDSVKVVPWIIFPRLYLSSRSWLTSCADEPSWNSELIFIHAGPITTDPVQLVWTVVSDSCCSDIGQTLPVDGWITTVCLFPAEWRRWTLLSGQQVEHVSESSTHLLSPWSWRHWDTLWWIKWVWIMISQLKILLFSTSVGLSFISGHCTIHPLTRCVLCPLPVDYLTSTANTKNS